MERVVPTEPQMIGDLGQQILTFSAPLEDAEDLDPLLERIGDARYVLLGEASHGTHEYYLWRARISRRLIEEKGFRFIAVEGDWPDCYRVNRYIQGELGDTTAEKVLEEYDRWPTWMWANWEIVALAEWLRRYNEGRSEGEQVGFYGLDVYSLWESLYEVIGYLKQHHPDALRLPTGPSSASSPTPRTRRNTPAPRSSFQTPAGRRCWIFCGPCASERLRTRPGTRPASMPS
jgi:erythromycin esterase-like protein